MGAAAGLQQPRYRVQIELLASGTEVASQEMQPHSEFNFVQPSGPYTFAIIATNGSEGTVVVCASIVSLVNVTCIPCLHAG